MARPPRVSKIKEKVRENAQMYIKPEAVQPMFELHRAMDEALASKEYWPCLNNPYFYADYDQSGFEHDSGGTRILTEDQCEELCHGCPLLKQCYDFAVANDEKFGVWGGIDFSEHRYELVNALFPENEEED